MAQSSDHQIVSGKVARSNTCSNSQDRGAIRPLTAKNSKPELKKLNPIEKQRMNHRINMGIRKQSVESGLNKYTSHHSINQKVGRTSQVRSIDSRVGSNVQGRFMKVVKTYRSKRNLRLRDKKSVDNPIQSFELGLPNSSTYQTYQG